MLYFVSLSLMLIITSLSATPLHEAAQQGNVTRIEELLDAGANPHIKNNAGKRPIDIASHRNHDKAYEVLKAAE